MNTYEGEHVFEIYYIEPAKAFHLIPYTINIKTNFPFNKRQTQFPAVIFEALRLKSFNKTAIHFIIFTRHKNRDRNNEKSVECTKRTDKQRRIIGPLTHAKYHNVLGTLKCNNIHICSTYEQTI